MAGRNENFHSKEKVEELMGKFIEFIEEEPIIFQQIDWFYRDKSEEYFRDVEDRGNGVMEKHKKDASGDPRCPINGQIDGLFFQVNVGFADGEPMHRSVHGPMRLQIPSKAMFDMCPKMYFADFYCYGPGRPHYVTLVMTKNDSDADKFCMEHLPQIDLQKNSFLRFTDSKTELCKCNIWFEIFFTEDINISEVQGMQMSYVEWQNYEGPRWKNKYCSHCNVWNMRNKKSKRIGGYAHALYQATIERIIL